MLTRKLELTIEDLHAIPQIKKLASEGGKWTGMSFQSEQAFTTYNWSDNTDLKVNDWTYVYDNHNLTVYYCKNITVSGDISTAEWEYMCMLARNFFNKPIEVEELSDNAIEDIREGARQKIRVAYDSDSWKLIFQDSKAGDCILIHAPGFNESAETVVVTKFWEVYSDTNDSLIPLPRVKHGSMVYVADTEKNSEGFPLEHCLKLDVNEEKTALDTTAAAIVALIDGKQDKFATVTDGLVTLDKASVVSGVLSPIKNSDAANKQYVDKVLPTGKGTFLRDWQGNIIVSGEEIYSSPENNDYFTLEKYIDMMKDDDYHYSHCLLKEIKHCGDVMDLKSRYYLSAEATNSTNRNALSQIELSSMSVDGSYSAFDVYASITVGDSNAGTKDYKFTPDGLSMANGKIKNLANGMENNDAVNVSQLTAITPRVMTQAEFDLLPSGGKAGTIYITEV